VSDLPAGAAEHLRQILKFPRGDRERLLVNRVLELDAKLSTVREWADAQYETQIVEREICGEQVLRILDGK
jgi:hypothetical protein